MVAAPQRILVIRRDNIGDLLCTTPLLSALRARYPEAWIGVLANSYNAPALDGNPDIDEVLVYRKAKHAPAGTSRLSVWLGTLRMLLRLRAMRLDLVIIASTGLQATALRFARFVRPARIIAYGTAQDGISDPLPPALATTGHEAEAVMRLLGPLGLDTTPGPLTLVPNAVVLQALQARYGTDALAAPRLGIHISARKVPQRWPIERFAATVRALIDAGRFGSVIVFWAPGDENDPQHPGDDRKAAALCKLMQDLPVCAIATGTLEELIAGLSLCDAVLCADGGAMHVAAALGKPIVSLFGNSAPERWRPWQVPQVVLQKPSHTVLDISTDEVLDAFSRLTPATDRS